MNYRFAPAWVLGISVIELRFKVTSLPYIIEVPWCGEVTPVPPPLCPCGFKSVMFTDLESSPGFCSTLPPGWINFGTGLKNVCCIFGRLDIVEVAGILTIWPTALPLDYC